MSQMKPDEIRALYVSLVTEEYVKPDDAAMAIDQLLQENERRRQQLMDLTHGWMEVVNAKAHIKVSEDDKNYLLDLMGKTRLIYNEVRNI